MKLIITKSICLFLFAFTFNTIFAQAPQKMSYQAVIRNTSGNLIVDTPVGIKISILQGSTSGTEVFSETHNPTTSSNGLASIEIGAGTPITGTFATINWGLGPFFIKTETDPTGGTNYTISGTSQLLSVPYALYAEKTKFQGRNSIYIQDDISNAEAQAILQEQFGPNTENIYVRNTKGLTNLDLSMVTNLTNLEITNNKDLVTLSTDNLSKCYNSILISLNNLLTQINLPILQEANNVSLNGYLVSIQLPQFTSGNFTLTNCSTLQTFQLPQFTSGNVSIGSNNALQTFQLPQFTTGNFSITNASSLQYFQLPQFTTGNLTLKNTNIDSFNVPQYTTGDVEIAVNPLLLQVFFPQFNSPNFLVKQCNLLEIINLPSVTVLNKLELNTDYDEFNNVLNPWLTETYYTSKLTIPNLKHLLLPSLITINTNFLIKGTNIETLNISSLTTTSFFSVIYTKISSLITPSLMSANLIHIRKNNFLQSVNIGGLVSVSAINCSLNPLLTSINLSSLSSLAGSSTNFSYFAYNALPSSQINVILHQLLTVSPSIPKTVGLDHQTPLAPPTGVGITDKATLISQGNNIATD